MAIETVKVRAIITIGSLTVKTPYIYSFNVNRQRANPSSMSASLKVKSTDITSGSTGTVTVRAGTRDSVSNNLIFTGDIYSMRITPCWEDPSYVMLSIEAKDVLARLLETKFTRRQSSSEIMFALITSASNSYTSGRFNTISEASKLEMAPEATAGAKAGAGYSGQPSSTKTSSDTVGKQSPIGITIQSGDQ